jgi:uroporphyrinogen-III synthase
MRVLITRPEREAAALAAALSERGHKPVIAPLFRLEMLHPPPGFAAALAACQAVLLTSANGARALAEASDQRGRPILAVGDTTATTAEGLGFSAVSSASGDGEALVDLVRRRLDAKAGPLLHVSGVDVSFDPGEALGRDGFEVQRFALYDAREAAALPDSARAALQARALDVATFFSPRAAALFAHLLGEAGLAESVRGVTALAISPAALEPLADLPFTAAVAAARPTRQAVLDEIDRLASAGVTGVKGQATMSDAPASSPPPTDAHPVDAHLIDAQPVKVRRGLGVFGAFLTGLVAAVIVLAAALISLPYWPQEARALWPGQAALPPAPTPGADLASVRAVATTIANATVDAAKRELNGRLDDLEKRLRALSATAAERPATADPAIGELRSKIEALENRPAAQPPAATSAGDADKADREVAALRTDIAGLRTAVQTLDQAVSLQREQTKTLSDAVGNRGAAEQKALTAAHASAVIGIAARLSSALDSGRPFAGDLALLMPLIQGDAKLGEIATALQPYAQAGVPSRAALAADFPAVAKAALADDLADDSFGERLLGKLKSIVSLRRVGDVQGDSVEAKLARAEAALDGGDLAKAVEIVKSLPAQTAKATAAWLARAETHLAAKRGVDQLAAHAVALLGTAR